MNNFREYLIKNCNAEYGIVGNFSDAISENFNNCNFYGIDGDKFKNDNYNKYYSYIPKSCDVIKCLDNKLDFIEFKTLYIGDVKIINKKINEFELTKKIEGSYDLLKKINYNNKTELIKKVNKIFYVSIYLHGFNSSNRFVLAKNIQKIKRNLEGYFKNYPIPFGENFGEPKFIKTENINDLYQ